MASGPDTEYMEEEKRGVRKYDMRRVEAEINGREGAGEATLQGRP